MKQNYKEHIIKKRYLKNLSLIIDSFAFLVVIVFALIDTFSKLNFRCFACIKNLFIEGFVYEPIMLINLLPLIITIISIVIAYSKNDVYGIPLNKFQKLCDYRFYSLFHIFKVTIVSFLIYLVFYMFDFKLSIICLEVVIIAISFIFGLQQLSIFTDNKLAVESLIICKYKIRRFRIIDDQDNDSLKNTYNKLLRNYIVSYGIRDLYEKLVLTEEAESNQIEKTKILFDLLNLKYDYFKKFISDDKCLDYIENIKGLITIYTCDLGFVFEIEDQTNMFKGNYCERFKETINLIHELNMKLGTTEQEKEIYWDIFEKVKHDDQMIEFLLSFTISTIVDDETWFLKYYASSFGSNLFYQNEFCDFSIFVTMMICYLLDNSDDVKETNLSLFFDNNYEETSNGLNGETWCEMFRDYIFNCSKDDIIKILSRMFAIFDLVEKQISDLRKYKFIFGAVEASSDNLQNYIENGKEVFSKKTIFRYWVICQYFNLNIEINNRKLLNIIGNLRKEDDKLIQQYLKSERFSDDYKRDKIFKIFGAFKLKQTNDMNDIRKLIKDSFKDNGIDSDNVINNEEDKETEIEKDIKEKIQRSFKSQLQKLAEIKCYDASINKFTETRQFVIVIAKDEMTNEFNNINEKFGGNIFENMISRILLSLYNRDLLKEAIKDSFDIKKNKIKCDKNLFIIFEDDAIRFNADIENTKVKISGAGDILLNRYINSKYAIAKNNKYFYINEDKFYLLTKDQLREKLKGKINQIFVMFKYTIIINEKKCFFERKIQEK